MCLALKTGVLRSVTQTPEMCHDTANSIVRINTVTPLNTPSLHFRLPLRVSPHWLWLIIGQRTGGREKGTGQYVYSYVQT